MESSHDLPSATILDLLLEAETAETPERFSQISVDGIVRLIPVDVSAAIFVDDPVGPRFLTANAELNLGREFNEYYRLRMPPLQERLTIEHQTDFREWEAGEYVTDLIRRHSVGRSAISATHGFSLCLQRSLRSRPFSDREIAILRLAGTHLANLYERFFPRRDQPFDVVSVEELAGRRVPLTRRESEVLALARRRLTSAEIASQLRISRRTVEKHFANMYERTGTGSRWELLRLLLASNTAS